ncbi:hypothetical protein MBLNU230_g5636t1 [Neophaeotheca triangularis]
MAIDQIPYRDADDLVDPQQSFYPLRIPISHWQLRHYISNSPSEPDLIYYASGHDVYFLNTATKKRKHIVTLPFEARCTASGYGWVCVGGEDEGHFAAVKLDGTGAGAEVDDSLPLETDRYTAFNASARESRRTARTKVERIGEEIVNSISIHRIQDEEAHLDDIVAVLTNNDKTVRMYSLPRSLETSCLDLPFAINHATISPDGKTLVAVGDDNQAHFFWREMRSPPPQIPKPHNRLRSDAVEWVERAVVRLHISERHEVRGYFTTAWNPSGRLVAVGSEGGYVTVFDMALMDDPEVEPEEAIVATVPGSRADQPPPHPGAVRSITFSPDPWDLLIWAEDQGRICVGDLRVGLRSKQVVELDLKNEKLDKQQVQDLPGGEEEREQQHQRSLQDLEAEFLRRHRRNDNGDVNYATEYIEARRRHRQARQELMSLRSQTDAARSAMEDDPHGLTTHEQRILETLRTTRQREEARSQGEVPRNVNYTTADLFSQNSRGSSSRSTPNSAEAGGTTMPASDVLDSMAETFPELTRAYAASERPTSSRGRDSPIPPLRGLPEPANIWESAHNDGPQRQPRRRASILLTPPESNSGSGSTARREAQASDEDNPWRQIQTTLDLERGPLFEGAARAPPIPEPTDQEESATESRQQTQPTWHLDHESSDRHGITTTRSPDPVPTSARPTPADIAAEREAARQRARAVYAASRPTRNHAATERSSTTRGTRTPAEAASDAQLRAITSTLRSAAGPGGISEDDLRLLRENIASVGDTARLLGDDVRAVRDGLRAAARGDGGSNTASPNRNTGANPSSITTAIPTTGARASAHETRRLLEEARALEVTAMGGARGLGRVYGFTASYGPLGGAAGTEGVRTAGLAVSPDGGRLWAATEEGIFELSLRTKGRRVWGAVEVV